MRLLLVCAFALVTLACGGGGSGPTAPSPTNQFPAVAGSYTGTMSVVFPELSPAATVCPVTTTVTQNGGSLSIAPLAVTGACGTLSLPVGSVTIDQTGAFLGQTTGSYFEQSCQGTYNWVLSGGFFSREMRLSILYTSSTCYNMNISFTLAR